MNKLHTFVCKLCKPNANKYQDQYQLDRIWERNIFNFYVNAVLNLAFITFTLLSSFPITTHISHLIIVSTLAIMHLLLCTSYHKEGQILNTLITSCGSW